MRRGADAGAAEADVPLLLRPGDKLGDRLRRHVIAGDDEDVGQFPGQRRRDHVAFRIVGHVLVEELVDGEMADGGGADGVAVRRAAGDRGDADIAAGARTVFDDEGLAENLVEPLGQNARQHVGRAAGRIRHDDLHRAVGPRRLAARAGRDQQARGGGGPQERSAIWRCAAMDIDPSPVVTMTAMLAGIVATSGNRPPSMKRRSRRNLLIAAAA